MSNQHAGSCVIWTCYRSSVPLPDAMLACRPRYSVRERDGLSGERTFVRDGRFKKNSLYVTHVAAIKQNHPSQWQSLATSRSVGCWTSSCPIGTLPSTLEWESRGAISMMVMCASESAKNVRNVQVGALRAHLLCTPLRAVLESSGDVLGTFSSQCGENVIYNLDHGTRRDMRRQSAMGSTCFPPSPEDVPWRLLLRREGESLAGE